MIIKGKTSWTGCWRENRGLVIQANREKLLLLFIFLVLCFPAPEAVVFCRLETGTNNELAGRMSYFVEGLVLFFFFAIKKNLFGNILHFVSPLPLSYTKCLVWNAVWCPGCLVAPPVLKTSRIACSKCKNGWAGQWKWNTDSDVQASCANL